MSDARTQPQQVFVDTCCFVNLLATGRLPEILSALPYRFSLAWPTVESEIRGFRLAGELAPIDRLPQLRELEADGLLTIVDPASTDSDLQDSDFERFVDLAAKLDDGEAWTAALAIGRAAAVATDDRKAIRVLASYSPGTPVIGTGELLQAWASDLGRETTRVILRAVTDRARFSPRRDDPIGRWWWSVLE